MKRASGTLFLGSPQIHPMKNILFSTAADKTITFISARGNALTNFQMFFVGGMRGRLKIADEKVAQPFEGGFHAAFFQCDAFIVGAFPATDFQQSHDGCRARFGDHIRQRA